ncbi:MAG: efflux RND transporter periplasmic adaptor subunit [Polyangiaceae bacterium]
MISVRWRSRTHLVVLLSSLLLAGALGSSGCKKSSSADLDTSPAPMAERRGDDLFVPEASPLRTRIKVDAVKSEDVQRQLLAPAAVQAVPTQMAKIAPPLAGRVVKLFVHFGDTVKAGTPLFSLDSADLVSSQSDYLKAKSAVAQAELNLARQKDLHEHGIGAERELEQAQTEHDTASDELERTKERLALLRVGPGNIGGLMTVVSPIAGRVIDLSTAPGQYQNDPATVLMIVADLSTVWVTANVQEKDIRRVSQGDEAVATFVAYPGENFSGHVLFVGDLLDPETRTIKVRVAFPNPDTRLKPGMFATVTFKNKAIPEIVVPTTAVVISGEKSQVFVEKAPWTFEKRVVEVGEQVNGRIAIAHGLDVGDRIVIENAVMLP